MKFAFTTLFLCFFEILNAQKLNDTIIMQPDGITISYFNSKTSACLPHIFIGSELKILFPCYNNGDYKRIDIGQANTEIKKLQKLLTLDFITTLNQCCYNRGCPDTNHGFYLMIKNGSKTDFQYLDIKHTNKRKCGTVELEEIIELLNSINEKYG